MKQQVRIWASLWNINICISVFGIYLANEIFHLSLIGSHLGEIGNYNSSLELIKSQLQQGYIFGLYNSKEICKLKFDKNNIAPKII